MKKTICSLAVFALSMLQVSNRNLDEKIEFRSSQIFENVLQKKPNRKEIFSKYIQNINPPKFKMGFEECSGYLRNSAYELFKKNYSWGDSWNMRYHNKIVSYVNDSSDIYNLIEKGIMRPGMTIGFYNPKSNHKNEKDEKGKKVQYTHVALYVGTNKNLEPEFVHQEGFNKMKSTLNRMLFKKYKPVILMDAYEQQNGKK